jgi:predicted Zn-dependent protease
MSSMRAVSESPAETSADDRGFLSETECRAIFNRCVELAGNDQIELNVFSAVTGGVRWARNRAFLSKEVRDTGVWVTRINRGRAGTAITSQIDDRGLRDAMQVASDVMHYKAASYETRPAPTIIQQPSSRPTLWSDATVAFDGARRDEMARQLIDAAEDASMVTAGDLQVRAASYSVWKTDGTARYSEKTRVAFSTTVRDAKGTASGWAGTDDFDVTRIDMKALGRRALEKGMASRNPSAIEPGRYTTILEPQAVADLFNIVVRVALDRVDSEDPRGEPYMPFNRGGGLSKIGMRLLDPRITVSADPMDPEGGFTPFALDGNSYVPVKWFDQGVLRDLAYFQGYALRNLGTEIGLPCSWSWRMSSGPTSVDEMIATTKRGVLVTRFHGVEMFHMKSLTCTGYTRDGLWLIEDGKITKPIKNFRFTESPLFVLNKVEQIGPSRRVFSGHPAPHDSINDFENARIAPTLKVQDFNFTQLADAV